MPGTHGIGAPPPLTWGLRGLLATVQGCPCMSHRPWCRNRVPSPPPPTPWKAVPFHPHCFCDSLVPQGDILEDDEDYLEEINQTVVSDSDLAGDDLSDAPGSTAAAPPSKSPALTKKKQHPTYKGSLDLSFPNSPWHRVLSVSQHLCIRPQSSAPASGRHWALERYQLPAR